ncbi:hypothetical protein GOP47_0004500 [Adiantum capillus-veneris]|uniref:NB-ARC domain-containing protein n=1 Tax=Adiantum capillus-veneris TaxID=13818 RepID=A0A9D4V872_ADICA|nr:hypothetical protein GOP47_0004500 [Adiantum capillus-veneris]
MSTPKNPLDVEADGDACWTCLLAHLTRHISCCLSCLSRSLSPASLAHGHTSALARLLDRLVLSLPPQQQHLQLEDEQPKEPEVAAHGRFPNSVLQLDIFQVLLFITENLRVTLSTVAKSCSDEVHEHSARTREEAGLLDDREVYAGDSNGCLERLLVFFQCRKIQAVQKEAMVGMEIDSKELSKRLMELVSDLQQYSDHLASSLRKVHMKLSSTVALMTSRLTSSQQLTISSTTAYMRMQMRSFLYSHEEDPPSKPEIADLDTLPGGETLIANAEIVIKQLLNRQGPRIVGLGGSRGIGKTCLASHVACNKRIPANFPGGIYYLSVGAEPDLTSLQAQLWKRMWSSSLCYSISKPTFSTPEEGTAALMSRAQEGLPSLLVLDDVFDAAHVKPFLCFDSNDRGRVLVISHAIESVLEKWNVDTFVLVLEHLDEEEANCLLMSIAGCQDAERDSTWAALSRNCGGTPRLVEAAASIVYYGKDKSSMLPSVLSFLKPGVIAKCEARPPDTKMFLTSRILCEGEKAPQVSAKGEKTSLLDSTNLDLCVFFNALADIHPCLQECFLDLAAFPKGKWVSLSALVDVWSFGNRMEKERAFFLLCFLASRSLVEWTVDESVDNECDQVFAFHWRLTDVFHELAQALIQSKLEQNNKEEKIVSGQPENGLYNCAYDVNGILYLLRDAVKAVDTAPWLQTYQITCCLHEPRNKKLHDVLLNRNSGRGRSVSFSTLFQTNFRLFFPDWQLDHHTAWWNEGNFASKATKLSLISTNLTEFPTVVDFSELKIALLSSNATLRSIPESPFKCMEQLVVLDLKHCASLTSLPDSICYLQCLEVLELSFCTQLLWLPRTIGKLKVLKYLCLSGCLSLTCLPVSVGSLMNLTMLDLSLCSRLKSLPKALVNLSCLQILNISGCYSLQCLPDAIASLRKLRTLVISGCSNLSHTPSWFEQFINMVGGRTGGAMAVPSQLWELSQVEVLHLCSLKNLTFLPQSIGKLQHLRHLNLSSCRSLDYLPDEVGSLFLLEKLDLSHTAVRKLPPTLGQLSSLVRLCLQGCSRLLCIPPSLATLPKLERLEMAECWDFVMLPAEFGNAHSMPKLIELDLSGCSIKNLPCFAKGALPMLRRLYFASCENLLALPDTFSTLTSLERIDLGSCKSLASLQGIGLAELKLLQWINLRNCLSLACLPVPELLGLQFLKFLDVSGCTKLSPFPEPLLQSARDHKFTLVRWGALYH